MKRVIFMMALALAAMGASECEDDGGGDACLEIKVCINEHESALGDCPNNPADGLPFEWPDDCEEDTTPGTDRDFFCEHMAALIECEDDRDAAGC